MAEYLAKHYPNQYFFSAHPGWADTPAVRESMPSFHAHMKRQLRTPEQGADCIIWAAVCPLDRLPESGSFLEDRRATAKHLPFASTRYTEYDVEELVEYLNDRASGFEQDVSANTSYYDENGEYDGSIEDYQSRKNEPNRSSSGDVVPNDIEGNRGAASENVKQ
jgi:hypothetical protein